MDETCFFSPSLAGNATRERPYIVGAIDLVDPLSGTGKYSGQTLEEVRQRHPDARIETLSEALRLTEQALIKPPKEIDSECFFDRLGDLPPAQWQRLGPEESFHCSDRVAGRVVTWCVRIGARYFELRDCENRQHADLVRACRAALNSVEA